MGVEATYGPQDVAGRLVGELRHWRLEDGHLVRDYPTANWKASLMATMAVGHLAELAWHHPDLRVSWGGVQVRLTTHSAGGITDKDFALAAEIERLLTWRPTPDGPLEGTPADPQWRYLLDE